MYPFLRMALALRAARRLPPIGLFDTHVSRHTCWPWDLDPWNELNNGRTLTLYDLGRVPFGRRLGFDRVTRARGWGMTVAGVSVRYRRRVRGWDRLQMRTRLIGWDVRFLYLDQSLWSGDDCANQMLLRSAVVAGGRSGLVPPADLMAALGHAGASPVLPAWVAAWSAAEALRPWPPDQAAPPATGPEPGNWP